MADIAKAVLKLPPEEGIAALEAMGFTWDTTGNARWFRRNPWPGPAQWVYWGSGGWQAGRHGDFFAEPGAAVLDAELNNWWQ